MTLKRRLHPQMVGWRETLRRDEVIRQRRVAPEELPELRIGVILDGFLARRAAGFKDAALIAEIEHRLDAARYIPGNEGNRAGRRDRCQEAVAKAMALDQRPRLGIEALEVSAFGKSRRIIERKRPLL